MLRLPFKSNLSTLIISEKNGFSTLFKEVMSKKIPKWQEKIKELRDKHGEKEIGKIKVEQVMRGMQGMPTMFYSTSMLNPKIGVTYRGYSVDEISEYLPKAIDGPDGDGDEPMPEALLWLLITGNMPTPHEYEEILTELQKRGNISDDVKNYIMQFPKEMHPLTQLSSVMLYLQPNSLFTKASEEGVNHTNDWEYVFEDALNLIAVLPQIAAYIYCHKYKNDVFIEPNNKLDWGGNLAHMIGIDSYEFREFIRGYMTLHADHDGGDVSSHTSYILGTALADPYLAYSGAVNGLSGPLHGFVSHDSFKWLIKMQQTLGKNVKDEAIKEYVINYLSEDRIIPGYGHNTLKHLDSRFLHQKVFIQKFIKNDPLVTLAHKCYRIIPGLLKSMKNMQDPWPNVDALSGVILNYYGVYESEFYIVFNALARSIGCMANLVIARSLNLKTERPNSINLEWLDIKFQPKEEDGKSPIT